jgi:uncharacterized protein YbjT (DUF2867 family)
MSHLVTVTGATGHIGSGIAERLLKGGHRVRGVVRDAKKFSSLAKNGAESRVGDIADAKFLADAFSGADAVFAMIPTSPIAGDIRAEMRQIAKNIVEALKASSVKHVVALSSIGGNLPSGTGPIAGLHEFEELLKSVPDLSLVILRPTYFMENFIESIPMIKDAGINGSAVRGDVSMPMIATRDIAEAAAKILETSTFEGQTVRELLGPRQYTFREATSILGTAIGKPELPYVDLSPDDLRKGLLDAGLSESVADAYLEMENAFNNGSVQATVTRSALNTTPTTLEEFARDTFVPAYKGAAAEAGASK